MSRGFFFLIMVIMFSVFANAGPNATYTAVTAASGWQWGMEVELSGTQALKNVLVHYDIQPEPSTVNEVRSKFTNVMIDNYLNPNSFEQLPKDVRDLLTDGKPFPTKIEFANVSSGELQAPSALILPEGYNAAEGRREIYLGEQKPTFGHQEMVMPKEKPSDVVLRDGAKREVEWNRVLDRWKKLDIEKRRGLIELNQISTITKANLIMDGDLPVTSMKLKADADPKVRDLLSRLKWFREGGLIEFIHATPVKSKQEYLKDLRLFADIAGIRSFVEDPNTKFPPAELRFTHHGHVSRYGESLDGVVERVGKVRLFELMAVGRGGGALYGDYGYRMNPAQKGLVRQVQSHHMESRIHSEGPAAEMDKLESYLQMPKAEAIAKLDAEIQGHVTRITKEIVDAGRSAMFEKDAKKRKVLQTVISDGFESLGRAEAEGWSQSMIDTLVPKNSPKEKFTEVRDTIHELMTLNQSGYGSRFLLPVASEDDIVRNFDRLATSYINFGAGKLFIEDFARRGFSASRLSTLLDAPMAKHLSASGADPGFATSLFVKDLPPEMHYKFWKEVVAGSQGLTSLGTMAAIWRGSGNPQELKAEAEESAALLNRALMMRGDNFDDYLRDAKFIRRDLKSSNVIEAFGREVLKRVLKQPSFSFENPNAQWVIASTDQSHLPLLRKLAAQNSPADFQVLKRLIELGDSVDEKTLDAFLRRGLATNVRDLMPTLAKAVSEASADEKRKYVELARSGAFRQLQFTGIGANKGERKIFLEIVNEIVGASAPDAGDVAFVQLGFAPSFNSEPYGTLTDKLKHDIIVKSLNSPVHPEWKTMILDSWKDERFISVMTGPPRVAWSREWFQFLHAEMKNGGDSGAKAAAIFDRFLVGEKNRILSATAGDALARQMITARKAFPAKKYSGFELGRAARAGKAAADFVIEQIGEDANRVGAIANDKLGSKVLRDRLLERQLVQDRNGKRSALYQALSGAPESFKTRRSMAKVFAADVANLAPVKSVSSCAERFGRLGH